MTPEEAKRLLERSREQSWAFPSSFGDPGPPEAGMPGREEAVEATRVLLEAGEDQAATALAAVAWRLWMVHPRDVSGGRAFVSGVLEAADGEPARERALALYGAGLLALRAGDREESRRWHEEALEAARASGDAEALTLAHLGASREALEDGDAEEARSHAVQAREHAEGLGPAFGQALLHMHAQALRLGGDLAGAAELFEESLALNRRIGDRGMVVVELHNLGHVEIRGGGAEAAERYFEELARTPVSLT